LKIQPEFGFRGIKPHKATHKTKIVTKNEVFGQELETF